MALPCGDFPSEHPYQRECLGCGRLVHPQRLAHLTLPCHVRRGSGIHPLHLRCLQYSHAANGVLPLSWGKFHNPAALTAHSLISSQTNQRTLEQMNLLFAADSPWVWEAEKNYKILVEENPELVQAATRGSMAAGDLEAHLRKMSTWSGGEKRRASLAPRRLSEVGLQDGKTKKTQQIEEK